jgi:hypothetical protein
MKTCPVTGRIHRTARELKIELARIDAVIAGAEALVKAFEDAYSDESTWPVPEGVGNAWNAATDALDALIRDRASVEMNPRPMPVGAAGTWALVCANID